MRPQVIVVVEHLPTVMVIQQGRVAHLFKLSTAKLFLQLLILCLALPTVAKMVQGGFLVLNLLQTLYVEFEQCLGLRECEMVVFQS
jgi:hypothetical protein